MTDNPRLEKSARLLELARKLAASPEGMTLDEMARDMGVGRRTAERMRDAIGALFPHMEDEADGASKRFRITGGLDGFLQAPTVGELAELEKARSAAAKRDDTIAAAALSQLATKIQAALKTTVKNRIAPDLEALMRAEAVAVQPGPRPMEDPGVLNALRQALLRQMAIAITYAGGTRPGERRTLIPYGLIFGEDTYLVAVVKDAPPEPRPRMYRLDLVSDVAVLDLPGSPPADFDLEAFAARSFGVYQEEPSTVVLRILPRAARQAQRYRFHPNQTLETLPDGGLRITMRAGGLRELSWKLFRWRDDIVIEGPQALKDIMAEGLALAREQVGQASP